MRGELGAVREEGELGAVRKEVDAKVVDEEDGMNKAFIANKAESHEGCHSLEYEWRSDV